LFFQLGQSKLWVGQARETIN